MLLGQGIPKDVIKADRLRETNTQRERERERDIIESDSFCCDL